MTSFTKQPGDEERSAAYAKIRDEGKEAFESGRPYVAPAGMTAMERLAWKAGYVKAKQDAENKGGE